MYMYCNYTVTVTRHTCTCIIIILLQSLDTHVHVLLLLHNNIVRTLIVTHMHAHLGTITSIINLTDSAGKGFELYTYNYM